MKRGGGQITWNYWYSCAWGGEDLLIFCWVWMCSLESLKGRSRRFSPPHLRRDKMHFRYFFAVKNPHCPPLGGGLEWGDSHCNNNAAQKSTEPPRGLMMIKTQPTPKILPTFWGCSWPPVRASPPLRFLGSTREKMVPKILFVVNLLSVGFFIYYFSFVYRHSWC